MTETDAHVPPTGSTAIWPNFVYRDAPAAIEFLCTAFGFTEVARYGEGSTVDHAELAGPEGGGIMLGSVRPESSLHTLPPGTGAAYLVVSDPDTLYERAKAAGAVVTHELQNEDYGSRGFACRDPEGVHWSFGTYAGARHPG
ncbi:VOC family protein [Nocardia stercoris]|uniref:Glyoxalase n=1 Tax=Nocardia stercoris TaxID=2483361 RepID=A0A3M2LBZ7_9NOCA|nr:VOC family protein [Nocardia stercoris]RMI35062.1 glyoxalase [Nocardia stercoris]